MPCVCVYTHIHTHTNMYIHICMQMYKHTCTCVCVSLAPQKREVVFLDSNTNRPLSKNNSIILISSNMLLSCTGIYFQQMAENKAKGQGNLKANVKRTVIHTTQTLSYAVHTFDVRESLQRSWCQKQLVSLNTTDTPWLLGVPATLPLERAAHCLAAIPITYSGLITCSLHAEDICQRWLFSQGTDNRTGTSCFTNSNSPEAGVCLCSPWRAYSHSFSVSAPAQSRSGVVSVPEGQPPFLMTVRKFFSLKPQANFNAIKSSQRPFLNQWLRNVCGLSYQDKACKGVQPASSEAHDLGGTQEAALNKDRGKKKLRRKHYCAKIISYVCVHTVYTYMHVYMCTHECNAIYAYCKCI